VKFTEFVQTIIVAALPIAIGLTTGLSFFWLLSHIEEWIAAPIAITTLAAGIVYMVHVRRGHRVFLKRLGELEAELKEYQERIGREL
jgi:hypothetical protein